MTKKKYTPRAMSWVTEDFIRRTTQLLPLEPETVYFLSEVASLLRIPIQQLNRDTRDYKTRQMATRGTFRGAAVAGKDLQPLLKSYLTRKPKVLPKVAELMTLETAVVPPPAETTPTDMKKVLRLFDKLTSILDKIPKDEARETAYRLARRYSRASSELKEGGENGSESKVATTLEEPAV